MNHLLKYKIFESEEEYDIPENIEMCKDFIETFNESEDKFWIFNYGVVFTDDNGHERYLQRSEDDKIGIRFNLGLPKYSDENHPLPSSDNIENVDDNIKILNKAKYLINRLSHYCNDLKFNISHNHIKFILMFENTDSESKKKSIMMDRILREIREFLSNHEISKTIRVIKRSAVVENRVPAEYKNLYELLKKNPTLSEVDFSVIDMKKQRYNNGLSIRCRSGIKYINDTIVIKISAFKYKESSDVYKSIKLSKEESDEVIKIQKNRILNKLGSDSDKLNFSIEGDQIKIKAKTL